MVLVWIRYEAAFLYMTIHDNRHIRDTRPYDFNVT